MPKYHVTEKGPRLCRAEVKECPYGLAGQEHFMNQEDAFAAYEKKMKDSFGVIPAQSKMERMRQESYKKLDAVHNNINHMIDRVKKSPTRQKFAEGVTSTHQKVQNARKIDYKETAKATAVKGWRTMSTKMLKLTAKAGKAVSAKAEEMLEIRYKSTENYGAATFVVSSSGETTVVGSNKNTKTKKVKGQKTSNRGEFFNEKTIRGKVSDREEKPSVQSTPKAQTKEPEFKLEDFRRPRTNPREFTFSFDLEDSRVS